MYAIRSYYAFEQLDSGKQGYITLDQLRQAHQAMMDDDDDMPYGMGMGRGYGAMMDDDDMPRGMGYGHRHGGCAGGYQGKGQPGNNLFDQADKDGNGQLSASYNFV